MNVVTKSEKWEDTLPPEILQQIIHMVQNIKYGQLTIIVQDSKVIQIDKIERLRLK